MREAERVRQFGNEGMRECDIDGGLRERKASMVV
ncbi:uncharacterized protein G2W53_015560 [Senna tora]|uniref:Uncharacterized protein n=1 Tax=Senna tora TaxID=362788 RepID=A0A834WVR4_9FABA|nr:uncharacterized protein G2W53_015560 [Senna tora]